MIIMTTDDYNDDDGDDESYASCQQATMTASRDDFKYHII